MKLLTISTAPPLRCTLSPLVSQQPLSWRSLNSHTQQGADQYYFFQIFLPVKHLFLPITERFSRIRCNNTTLPQTAVNVDVALHISPYTGQV